MIGPKRIRPRVPVNFCAGRRFALLPETVYLMGRRSFLKWATNGLGALFAAIIGIPAVAYLIDARNRKDGAGDFKTVGRFSELQPGVPTQGVIRDARKDAWTLHSDDIIGRVWLVRRDDKELDAFTTICPHLGCSVNFEKETKLFICPCHNGTYELSGTRKETAGAVNPAPRGMDKLPWRRDPADPDLIQVKYETFRPGLDKPELKQ
jgi:Rieske Fe-S protein